MALIDFVENVQDIGKQTLKLVLRPRTYITNKRNNPSQYISLGKTFVWLIGISLLLLKIYSTAFGPISEDMEKASTFTTCADTTYTMDTAEGLKVKPKVERIVWWSPGFGLGLNFLDHCKPSTMPQYCVFQVGGLFALVKDLKPEQFNQTGFVAFFLFILALVFTTCIYLAMWILRKKANLKELLSYTILYFYSYFFLATCIAITIATVCIHVLGLRGWTLYSIWMITVVLPLFIFSIRGYFAAYSQLFEIRKRRLLLGSVIAAFLSWLVSPVVFVPLLYLLLILIPIYDLLI
jgi:hypothetical protein